MVVILVVQVDSWLDSLGEKEVAPLYHPLMTAPPPILVSISPKDIQQEFTSITRSLRKDLDNLLQVLNTPHSSEQDRESAVMNAVQVLITYDARVGQTVNKGISPFP